MSNEQQVHLTNVQPSGITPDGNTLFIKVGTKQQDFLLGIPHDQATKAIEAIAGGISAAYNRRRERGALDQATMNANTPKALGFQFSVAADKSYMSLVAQTVNGPVELRIAPDVAEEFAQRAMHAANMLDPPTVLN